MIECGIRSPHTSRLLKKILSDLGATQARYTQRTFVPAYLMDLIRSLWVRFQEMQIFLKSKGYELEWLDFEPTGLTEEQIQLKIG
jgi:hypothetical protein